MDFKSRSDLFRYLGLVLVFVLPAALIAFFWIDQPLALWMQDPARQLFWVFNREITEIGAGSHFFAFSLTSYLLLRFGLRKKNTEAGISWFGRKVNLDWLQAWSIHFFLALCFSGTIVQLTKILVGRQRPHKSQIFENQIYSPLSFHWDWHSFPSGHSQTLFTVFVFLSLLWPKARWFIFATITYLCLTRAFTQAHFLSDVITGAFFGYAGALITINFFSSRSRLLLDDHFWMAPQVSSNSKNSEAVAGP
ncbi:MAG: phosphatase PAP2 family protein [Bdellovibrionales bacterium]|nr:phosphatase PAP2 family protein [Bdellovibrionales bacterium]